jgi:hypothetical protein
LIALRRMKSSRQASIFSGVSVRSLIASTFVRHVERGSFFPATFATHFSDTW